MSTKKEQFKTKDGFELHIGVNHLGTFLLTNLLLDSLILGAPSRVVTLASTNLAIAKLDLEDLMMEKRIKTGDGGREQYNMSKLAIAICIRKFAETQQENGITPSQVQFFLMCPGYVRTQLFRNETRCCRRCSTCVTLKAAGITPHQAAQTVCYLCLSKSLSCGDNCGRGEMYRFMKVWKMGERVLKKMDRSEEGENLYEMTKILLLLASPEVADRESNESADAKHSNFHFDES